MMNEKSVNNKTMKNKAMVIKSSWEIISIDPFSKSARCQPATQEIIEKLTEVELKFLVENEFVLIYRLEK